MDLLMVAFQATVSSRCPRFNKRAATNNRNGRSAQPVSEAVMGSWGMWGCMVVRASKQVQ
jgi:hypothetical protein